MGLTIPITFNFQFIDIDDKEIDRLYINIFKFVCFNATEAAMDNTKNDLRK